MRNSEEIAVLDRLMLLTEVGKLPAKQRAVLGLMAAGYTQSESGTILGLTGAAIGNQRRNILSRLYCLMQDGDHA